ncbi:GNAT family N-acetyltransferase [Aliiroseovarius sp. PTFE2010]|uniref:GNAT family N-acetyltransferase n=1 Tax=Aliiroseovarius sp. PTFE2010 TaxID=3417190 RepID=UPI003CF547AD
MTTAIDIRPIAAQDQSVWSGLWRDYLAFYETTVSDAQYELQFSRLIGSDPQDFNGFLAWIDERAVGLVHFLSHRHGQTENNVIYLQDLYAAADLRGRGIGRALIEAVYARADETGAPQVYWLTQEFNTTARRLYDQIATLTPFVKYQRS